MLTYQDIAAEAGVSVSAVKKWAQSGKLSVVRLGHRTVRVTRLAWDRFKQSRTQGGIA